MLDLETDYTILSAHSKMAAATPPVYGCWRFGPRVPTYFTGTWAENGGRDLHA